MEKRMKNTLKVLFVSLALLINLSCSYMKTDLGDETIDVSITQIKTSSGQTGVILSFNTIPADLVIPSKLQDLPVLKVSFAKTTNLSSLKTISIPSTVTEIDTFKGATSLKIVTLPDSMTTLPSFSGCSNLESVILPEPITEIPESCFENCKVLKNVSKPEENTETVGNLKGITVIGKSAFNNCTALNSIALETTSITELNDLTFYNCAKLSVVKLPDTIQSIDNEVFSGCSSITTFDIPENVTKIGISVFASTSLTKLYCYPKIPFDIAKTSLPEMLVEEEKQSEGTKESTTDEETIEDGEETEKEKVYKKVFTLYVPAESESLYKEKWENLVDWRVIEIKTLQA